MKKYNVALWVVQGLLAVLFAFAGIMKLVMPLDQMAGPVALPGLLIRFIGVAETLGAIGLILPGLLKIQQRLTPLAAVGLVIIMAGATVITAMGGAVAPALFPLLVGVLAASVAYGRRGPTDWPPAHDPRATTVSGVSRTESSA